SDGDAGALIGPSLTCFAVGLRQPCYRWSIHDDNAVSVIKEAVPKFDALLTKIYGSSGKVKFDVENAMTDVMGDKQARRCSAALHKQSSLTKEVPTECRISEIFAEPEPVDWVSFNGKSLKLIGLIVILDKEGVQLDTDGSPDTGEVHDPVVGKTIAALPPGSYLMFMTDPNAGIFTPEALYLL